MTLGTPGVGVGEIAVSGNFVYFFRPPTLLRVPADGSGREEILSEQRRTPVGLSSSASAIYWIEAGQVYTCSSVDCETPMLLSVKLGSSDTFYHDRTATLFLARPVDSGSGEGSALWTMAVPNGTPTTLGTQWERPRALAADDEFVYWLNDVQDPASSNLNFLGGIYKLAFGRNTRVPLLSGITGFLRRLAVAPGVLYFAGEYDQGDGADTSVYKIPLPNGVGAGTASVFGVSRVLVRDIVADEDLVFWSSEVGLVRCPSNACAGTPVVVYPGAVGALAQDKASVYFATSDGLKRIAK